MGEYLTNTVLVILTVRGPGGKMLDNYSHCNVFLYLSSSASSYTPSGVEL